MHKLAQIQVRLGLAHAPLSKPFGIWRKYAINQRVTRDVGTKIVARLMHYAHAIAFDTWRGACL